MLATGWRSARGLIPLRTSSKTAEAAGILAARFNSTLPATNAPQAPNYTKPWSPNQSPRPTVESNVRFEQTLMEYQPAPLSAMEMIANEPIRLVNGRKATCDGGGGALGHPKIFINLDKPGAHACGYCGIRFEQAPHHGHEH